MEKEAFFPHYLCQFPEAQRVHSFKSAPYALARRWAMPSFQQQLSHRHRGEAPLGRPITLHCGDCAVQLLGGARSKASGGCMAMGFSLDSGLAVPWPELQEVIIITLQPAGADWVSSVARVSHVPCAADRPHPENGDDTEGFLFWRAPELCGLVWPRSVLTVPKPVCSLERMTAETQRALLAKRVVSCNACLGCLALG